MNLQVKQIDIKDGLHLRRLRNILSRAFVSFALGCLVILLCPLSSAAQERLLLMDVTARVREDASLVVTERIVFVAEGVEIRRGLIRDIPFIHKNARGREIRSKFKMISATLDGKPVFFETKRSGSVMEIHLGDDKFLSRGKHEYVVTYSMTDQLIFHEDGDELYWNVTGNDWIFPIERAIFRVELPAGAKIFEHDAAVGKRGSVEKRWRLNSDGSFETERSLGRGEGFTVTVTWPKGFVTEPPKPRSEIFLDNFGKPLYQLLCFIIILWYAIHWWRIGKEPKRGLIIPLFEAPNGFEPGYVGYVKTLGFDSVQFTADLVDLAVRGYLVLTPEGGLVTATRTHKDWDGLSPARLAMLQALFPQGRAATRLGGGGETSSSLSSVTQSLISHMSRFYKTSGPVLRKWNILPCLVGLLLYIPLLWLLSHLSKDVSLAMAILLGLLLPLGQVAMVGRLIVGKALRQMKGSKKKIFHALWLFIYVPFVLAFFVLFFSRFFTIVMPLLPRYLDISLVLPGLGAVAATVVFSLMMPARTKIGREYLDKIEGFELYLKTAEKHRLEALYPNVRGQVPEPTRETFERFLPYAFALGIAETWVDGFADMLRQISYTPGWYNSPSGFDIGRLSRNMDGISHSMRPPVSSSSSSGGSGRGGGVSSGGGRGGGGGRGR